MGETDALRRGKGDITFCERHKRYRESFLDAVARQRDLGALSIFPRP
jgi:hypothetical protein